MKILNSKIPDVKIIDTECIEDYTGSHSVIYSAKLMHQYGIDEDFVQENHGYAYKCDCFRGIHCQIQPFTQSYLLRCISGAMLDFAVDLRQDSPTYKKSVSIVLSEQNRRQVYIPRGFGHACLSLTDNCEFTMKVGSYYEPSAFNIVSYLDPALGIELPSERVIISKQDKDAKYLNEHCFVFDLNSIKENNQCYINKQKDNDLFVTNLALPEVKVVQPKYYEDFRGFFAESYSAWKLKDYGIDAVFVQDDHSYNIAKGTFRGIHFQNNPHAQGKLIRCTRGCIMNFAVDLRRDSPNFKKWVYVVLSAENRKQIWIPRGFGHAYLTLEDNSEVQYKYDDFQFPELQRSIRYDDPEINLKLIWKDIIRSNIDLDAPYLRDSDINFSTEDRSP